MWQQTYATVSLLIGLKIKNTLQNKEIQSTAIVQTSVSRPQKFMNSTNGARVKLK